MIKHPKMLAQNRLGCFAIALTGLLVKDSHI